MAKHPGSAGRSSLVQGCRHLRIARPCIQGQQRRWYRRFSRLDPETGLSSGSRGRYEAINVEAQQGDPSFAFELDA
jgi:hypothetical protein